ncbi:uncharacterized protein HaLaN_24367 [Haematococcus lacustris]|uniref:Uncharacterized protein n=1 Tax=Haematococcus lacustris TaxID=44745 RepID=A0A6A0A1A0_HAELA|nr:uncharacterized protein HaLaN_24367 [Haematococcus lacustris]
MRQENTTSWDLDYCRAYTASAPVRASILEALAEVEASASGGLINAFDSFSKLEYEYECPGGKRQLAVPIEPLYGAVRHPAAITCNSEGTAVTDMSLIMSLKHLVLSSNPRDAAPTHQRFLFDMGASHWNDLSQSALIALYSKRGIFFDRHLMWEAGNRPGADIMKDVPRSQHHNCKAGSMTATCPEYELSSHSQVLTALDVLSADQYFNIPAVADIKDPGNPLNIIMQITKPHDFVALKLDIDHAPTEASFIQQILDNTELSSRIDELFWEAHFNVPPLINCCWGGSADKSMGFSKQGNTTVPAVAAGPWVGGHVAACSPAPGTPCPWLAELQWAPPALANALHGTAKPGSEAACCVAAWLLHGACGGLWVAAWLRVGCGRVWGCHCQAPHQALHRFNGPYITAQRVGTTPAIRPWIALCTVDEATQSAVGASWCRGPHPLAQPDLGSCLASSWLLLSPLQSSWPLTDLAAAAPSQSVRGLMWCHEVLLNPPLPAQDHPPAQPPHAAPGPCGTIPSPAMGQVAGQGYQPVPHHPAHGVGGVQRPLEMSSKNYQQGYKAVELVASQAVRGLKGALRRDIVCNHPGCTRLPTCQHLSMLCMDVSGCHA